MAALRSFRFQRGCVLCQQLPPGFQLLHVAAVQQVLHATQDDAIKGDCPQLRHCNLVVAALHQLPTVT